MLILALLWSIQLTECFRVSPVNQSVPINTTAVFFCSPTTAFGQEVIWTIQLTGSSRKLASSDYAAVLASFGFLFSADDDTSWVHVVGSVSNNGSSLVCREFDEDLNSLFSDTAFLTVTGPPLPPEVRTSLTSATEIILEWEEPFTSQGYPILNYTVVETEIITGQRRTFTSHALNHTHTIPSIATQCREIEFAVAATNAVGDSELTTVIAGFPIAPENKFSVFDVTAAKMTDDGTSWLLVIIIKPPPVCAFQTALLTLQLLHADSKSSLLVNSTMYSGDPQTITLHVTTELIVNSKYSLSAIVTTIAGEAMAEKQLLTGIAKSVALDYKVIMVCSILYLIRLYCIN